MTTISDPSIMPPRPSVKLKRRPADGQATCPDCNHVFNVRGFGRHKQACHKIYHEEEPAPGVIDAEGGTYPEPGGNGIPHVYLVVNDPIDINSQIVDDQVTEIAQDLHAEGKWQAGSAEAGGSGEYG